MIVHELNGHMLDYFVAKSAGREARIRFGEAEILALEHENRGVGQTWLHFAPSTSWLHGGPIIERERIVWLPSGTGFEAGQWYQLEASGTAASFCGNGAFGETLLIAAMRAFVVSKFGNEVAAPIENDNRKIA